MIDDEAQVGDEFGLELSAQIEEGRQKKHTEAIAAMQKSAEEAQLKWAADSPGSFENICRICYTNPIETDLRVEIFESDKVTF